LGTSEGNRLCHESKLYLCCMAKLAKSTPAMDKLVDSFKRIVSKAKERLPDEEFQQAEKQFDNVVNKVRAARGRQRETA
jgi:hypothetical protein